MFKTELDKETGKYKIFNKKKGEYSKRMFSTKESANKMVDLYTNFSTRKRETDILKRGKEVKAAKAAGVSSKTLLRNLALSERKQNKQKN